MRIATKAGLVLAASTLGLGAAVSSCASVSFDRQTQTSGTFHSSGIAVTVLSWDLPKRAIDIARDNASDAGLVNMQVERETVTPYLGWFDWVLDIFSVRFASVSGTWGYDGTKP
ncbi:MAG TPA: hypothetical protein VK843_19760 [Planctomycetota bacterium]|nr:hypothetical protein [Planctomycetota bacterium]